MSRFNPEFTLVWHEFDGKAIMAMSMPVSLLTLRKELQRLSLRGIREFRLTIENDEDD